MALAIKDGSLYNNDDTWEDYYVLDDDEDKLYRVFLNNDGDIEIAEDNQPEDNRILVDESTGQIYLLSVTVDGVLYVKTKAEMGADCCDWTKNTNHKVSRILRKMDIGR